MKILITENKLFNIAYKFISDHAGEYKLIYKHKNNEYFQWDNDKGEFFVEYSYGFGYGINENLYDSVKSLFETPEMNINKVWEKWLEDHLKFKATDIFPVAVGDYL
jgi:hypothetical protein